MPIELQQKAIIHFREQRPALAVTHAYVDIMARYMVGEIMEAQQEHNALDGHATQEDIAKLIIELLDTDVFRAALTTAHGVYDVPNSIRGRVNGQGNSSRVYDQMLSITGDFSPTNIERPSHELALLIFSLISHLPVGDRTEMVMRVYQKNKKNRPEEYYSAVDSQGMQLTQEETFMKYTHVETALRLLRKHFGSPLETWMHEAFANEILDFQHSEQSLKAMQERLSVVHSQFALSVVDHIRSTHSSATVDERTLLLAGAQLVSA